MRRLSLFIGVLVFLVGCSNSKNVEIFVENDFDIVRNNETIEIKLDAIRQLKPKLKIEELQVLDNEGQVVVSQKIDENMDGENDLLIFQTDLNDYESKIFTLGIAEKTAVEPKTYARFVPERENDFAWENDRVAFRMYSQQLAEKEGVDSGIDVWVKSVDYLVIDKWYKSEHYHEDHGEGLDFYKVGPSRGCGGLAILKDNQFQPSGGFVDYKVITNGPIRSTFELSYGSVEKPTEIRRINIDAGWNLNKVEWKTSNKETIDIGIGLKIQNDPEKAFSVKALDKGLVTLWEKISDENGSLGTAIIIKKDKVLGSELIDDHLVLNSKVENGETIEYYTGAGWDKSPWFKNSEDWIAYVENMAKRINHPVKVTLQ